MSGSPPRSSIVTVTSGDGANTVILPDLSGMSLPRTSSHGAGNDIGKAPAAPTNLALQRRTVTPPEHGAGEILDNVILAVILQCGCDVLEQCPNHPLRRCRPARWIEEIAVEA